MPTILITGATGFIGSHAVRHVQQMPSRPRVRLLTHRRELTRRCLGDRPVELVSADLTAPATLRGVCEGVDVLLHCASQIGGEARLCDAVNARGTASLMAEAQYSGVSRIVYLSTASVYGRATFDNARVEDLVRNPSSVTSRSRACAEDAVLAAGGTVLRPHIVYGTGDLWVARGLTELLRVIQGSVDGWPALLSVVNVEYLARALVATGFTPTDRLTAPIYHANHPEPVSCNALLRTFADAAGMAWPSVELSLSQAADRLRTQGGSTNHLRMVTANHWFDSTQLWADVDCDPGPNFQEQFVRHAAWYRRLLTTEV